MVSHRASTLSLSTNSRSSLNRDRTVEYAAEIHNAPHTSISHINIIILIDPSHPKRETDRGGPGETADI